MQWLGLLSLVALSWADDLRHGVLIIDVQPTEVNQSQSSNLTALVEQWQGQFAQVLAGYLDRNITALHISDVMKLHGHRNRSEGVMNNTCSSLTCGSGACCSYCAPQGGECPNGCDYDVTSKPVSCKPLGFDESASSSVSEVLEDDNLYWSEFQYTDNAMCDGNRIYHEVGTRGDHLEVEDCWVACYTRDCKGFSWNEGEARCFLYDSCNALSTGKPNWKSYNKTLMREYPHGHGNRSEDRGMHMREQPWDLDVLRPNGSGALSQEGATKIHMRFVARGNLVRDGKHEDHNDPCEIDFDDEHTSDSEWQRDGKDMQELEHRDGRGPREGRHGKGRRLSDRNKEDSENNHDENHMRGGRPAPGGRTTLRNRPDHDERDWDEARELQHVLQNAFNSSAAGFSIVRAQIRWLEAPPSHDQGARRNRRNCIGSQGRSKDRKEQGHVPKTLFLSMIVFLLGALTLLILVVVCLVRRLRAAKRSLRGESVRDVAVVIGAPVEQSNEKV